MADPLDLEAVIRGYKDDADDDICTIEATCVTGFEPAAQAEAVDELRTENVAKRQGRILFDYSLRKIKDVLSLRTVDNVYVIIGLEPEFGFDPGATKDENLERLIRNLDTWNWKKGLEAWNEVFRFEGKLYPTKEYENDSSTELPKFRCTCYRSGTSHNFSSMDVAKAVGGAIQDKFQWKVQMKDFDIEVVINIDKDQLYSTISLNKESLFKRNIEHFGPTTLRATICASLLKYADIRVGDVVVDPMCGGGSIPIEGALGGGGKGYFLAGEIHDLAKNRCRENVKSLEAKDGRSYPLDVIQWDVLNIPLRDNSVDVFITDLPFGKRSGSKADNRVLYPKTLLSMARVVKPGTGRAVLLTQDKTSMFKCTGKVNPYWKTTKQLYANIGGLAALVFILKRTDKLVI